MWVLVSFVMRHIRQNGEVWSLLEKLKIHLHQLKQEIFQFCRLQYDKVASNARLRVMLVYKMLYQQIINMVQKHICFNFYFKHYINNKSLRMNHIYEIFWGVLCYSYFGWKHFFLFNYCVVVFWDLMIQYILVLTLKILDAP